MPTETTETSPLDARALDDWIGDRLPGRGLPLRVERMGADVGIANALYWLRRGDHVWVLRRPPAVVNAPGASDMQREWRILTALEGTAVPHPTPLLFADPDAPLAGDFLIMSRVDGFTPVGTLPPPYDTPAARTELAFAMVDALVDLAAVDWRARGLDGLGRPDGFLERQVPRWLRQLDRYRTRDVPGLERVTSWLADNRPADGPTALMHGDYSPFNVMASPRQPTRLAAVVDWDTGTIGDPLLDIAHLLARWTEPAEWPTVGSWDIAPDCRAGLPTRARLAQRYHERSGHTVDALPYYEALALFKLAVILEGGVGRAATPAVAAERAARVDSLIRGAAMFASGERT